MTTTGDGDVHALTLLIAALTDEASLSLLDVCDRAQVDAASARRWLQALGRPISIDPTAMLYGEADLRLVERAASYRAQGLADDDLLSTARAIGRGVSGMADALGSLLGEALLRGGGVIGPGDAEAFAEEAARVVGSDGEQLMHLLAAAVLERFRSHAVAIEGARTARLRGEQDVAVAFVDLVGFTRLGETLSPLELALLAEELVAHAGEITTGEVRLTKTIGDAVMLLSADAAALITAVRELFERWHSDERGRPPLRAGIAYGRALPQGGDWFGPAVNLASRVTPAARPGGLIATDEARRAGERHGAQDLPWRIAAPRRFKGVRNVVWLHRLGAGALGLPLP